MEVESLRRLALEMLQAGLDAVEPANAVSRSLWWADDTLSWLAPDGTKEQWKRPSGGTIRLVGMGKAAAAMAVGVESVIGRDLAAGCVVVKDGHQLPTQLTTVLEAAHPLPDERGVAAAQAIELALQSMTADDLTIVLISGGGSALLPAPVEGVTLAEKQSLTDALLRAGADIELLNHVRRRLSRIKGGGMLRAAGGGTLLSLILSDVVGDPLDLIAAGPTVPPNEALDVPTRLSQLGLWDGLSERVKGYLAKPTTISDIEGDMQRGRASGCAYHNLLVATNRDCLEGCKIFAERHGFTAEIMTDRLVGEAHVVGVSLGKELARMAQEVTKPHCRLYGGETVVKVRGSGKGGRSQELAVAAAQALEGTPGAVLLAAGTDGTDGPTDAAGGLIDGNTASRARAAGIDPAQALSNNDSYPCLKATGDLVITGPTRTNVMDVQILLVDSTPLRHVGNGPPS
jgi:glycerate 2-kinase